MVTTAVFRRSVATVRQLRNDLSSNASSCNASTVHPASCVATRLTHEGIAQRMSTRLWWHSCIKTCTSSGNNK